MRQIETRPIGKLKASPANARQHSPHQIAQLARAMQEWGWTVPALIDEEGTILAGHGRVQAAKLIGWKDARVIVATGWSEAQKRAYVIADNRIAQNAGWDKERLATELGLLGQQFGLDLSLLGFGELEVAKLLDRHGERDEDEDAIPEPKEAVARAGDLWELGDHRLICGDATDELTVKRLPGAELMVTDPPYGVNYDPAWRNRAGVSETQRTGKVSNDDRADWGAAWRLFTGSAAYVWHAGVWAGQVMESLEDAGFKVRAQIVWAKSRLVLGRGDYHWQHEPCFYAVRGKANWQGARDQSTVWDIPTRTADDSATAHGTQKPVECMRRPILNNSARGEFVYEPFAGSGSTLIAAETVERRCLAIEIEPRYCDITIERWQDFTGGKAKKA